MNLPEHGLVTDGFVDLQLRGLSFSEGPGITDEVTVTVGDESATAEVENSLELSDTVRSDGVGTATVRVPVAMDALSAESHSLPVTATTSFGAAVTEDDGLSVFLRTDAAETPTEGPSVEPSDEPTQEPSEDPELDRWPQPVLRLVSQCWQPWRCWAPGPSWLLAVVHNAKSP